MSRSETYILALDQGTTSSRAIVFNRGGNIIGVKQIPFPQIYPKPGWVEHDPARDLGDPVRGRDVEPWPRHRSSRDQIEAIGITNQRETTVVWERATGKPVYNAIVWQCRRSADICKELTALGLAKTVHERTGLVLDPYFSGHQAGLDVRRDTRAPRRAPSAGNWPSAPWTPGSSTT